MNKENSANAVESLYEGILKLKDKKECHAFFSDLCTINELLSLAQRFEVARLLLEKRTYQEITKRTGASAATISRVNRSLNYGNKGYQKALKGLEEKE